MIDAFISRIGRWWVVFALAFAVCTGIALAWPEPPAELLTSAQGWEIEGGFVETQPTTGEIRRDVVEDRKARFWRSWNPQTGSQPGTLKSPPFVAPDRFVVPYNGFAGDPTIDTYIECMGSDRRLHIATDRTNTQWSEVLVDLPAGWCEGTVRLVARSESAQQYVSLGTPYRVGMLSIFKQSTLALAWYALAAWAFLAGLFSLCARYAARWRPRLDPVAGALIAIGLIGYGYFFLFWYFPVIARYASAILLLAIAVSLLRQRKSEIATTDTLAALPMALWLWLLAVFTLLFLVVIGDSGVGAWLVNSRFTPVRWSSDNQIPGLVGRALMTGHHESLGAMLPWQIGDRPPLAYGWHAIYETLFGGIAHVGGSGHQAYLYQLATGVTLNALWVPALVLLLSRFALSKKTITLIVMVVLFTPFFLFNNAYIWPKLLSGVFGFAAAWILLDIDGRQTHPRYSMTQLCSAAILSALAILTHGASAFGIFAMLLLAVMLRGIPGLGVGFVSASLAIALLLPWSLFQHAVSPPGNALVKQAFAGTFGFGEEHIGVADTIVRSYREISLNDWLSMKLDTGKALLFGIANPCGVGEMGAVHTLIDRWRGSDFYNVLPAMNFLLLGLVAIAVDLIRRAKTPLAIAARRLAGFAILTLLLTGLMTWGCNINHTQSYQALIALYAASVIVLVGRGKLGAMVVSLSLLYSAVVWVAQPLLHFPRFDYVAAGLFLICCAIWALWIFGTRVSSRPETKVSEAA